MSGITSTFPDYNSLYDAARVDQAIQGHKNALLTQEHNQQLIGQADIEMVARLGSSLINMSPEEAARVYPGRIAELQAQGYAKHAPPTYPGHDVTRQLVALGIPAEKQWTRQQDIAAAKDMYTPPTTTGAAPAVPGGGGGAGGTGGGGASSLTPFVATNLPSGVTAAEDQLVRTVIGEAGGEPLAGQQAVAHVIRNRSRIGNQDTQSVIFAPNQFEPWNNPATRAKLEALDPNSPQYQQILNSVVRPVMAGQAPDPTGGATHFYSPTAQAALGRPPPSWSQGGNRTTIGRHDFFYPGYSAPQQTAGATQPTAPGTTTATAAAPATPAPGGRVVIGDSLAVGVGQASRAPTIAAEGASPAAIAARIQSDEVPALNGKDVVLSTGASNNPNDLASVEQQLRTLQGKGAGKITVLGVGDRPDLAGVNEKLETLAKAYGADFQPIDPANLSADRVHPRDYTQVVPGGAPAARGAAARTGGVDVAGPGAGSTAAPGGAPGTSAQAPAATPAAPGAAPEAPAHAPQIGPPPTPPELRQSNGYTVRQNQVLAPLARQGKLAELDRRMAGFDDDNRQSAATYSTQVRQYQQDQRQAQQDATTSADRARAAADAAERLRIAQAAEKRQEAEAKRAGLPVGYRLDDTGKAVRIDGLPPDPAVLEAQAKAGQLAKQTFDQENTLRDEFQKLTGDFRIVQTSYENIRSAAKANDGAGDMSLLYNYVRLLDPTSVVRESEFAAAAASGSFGERVQGAVARVLNGARMPETLRQSFIREGKNLYDNQLRSHDTVADQYEELARSNGLEPKRVVTRFARPQGDSEPAAKVVTIKGDDEFDKLPSGTVFVGPDGKQRVKP